MLSSIAVAFRSWRHLHYLLPQYIHPLSWRASVVCLSVCFLSWHGSFVCVCVCVCVSVCIPFDGTGEIVCILSIILFDSLSVCL